MKNRSYIVFVDDDQDDRDLLADACESLGVKESICVFASARELFDFLSSLPDQAAYPALIVLDVNMPLLDGGETLQLLKHDARFRHIPVVMHTTSNNQETFFASRGADGYYQKPYTFQGLVKNVSSILTRVVA